MTDLELVILLRILTASVLGFAIGLERERHSRAAGLRTCILVAMASALLMSLSIHLSQIFSPQGMNSIIRLDPGRLPSYAVAGMGFLGAGAIIQGRGTAQGVTTAASLWACTGLGLAVGAGLYWPAVFTTVLALATLTLLRRLEKLIPKSQHVNLVVEVSDSSAADSVRDLLLESKARINFVGRERSLDRERLVYHFSLVIRSGPNWSKMLDCMEVIPKVISYDWRYAQVP